MFVNENYNNFKYIVSVSDNYIILTNVRTVNGSWDNPRSYDVIYQYIKPSTITIESERTTTQSLTFEEIEISNDYWDRADSLEITQTGSLILIILLIFINGITKLVKKGGLIFGQ